MAHYRERSARGDGAGRRARRPDPAGLARRGLPRPLRAARPGRADERRWCARSASACGSTPRSGSARTSSSPRSPPTPRSRAASSSSPASRRPRASRREPPRLIPGIGPKTAERLRRSGSRRSARCSAARSTSSSRRFGDSHGRGLHDRAHFRDDSPVARREAKSRSVETTFDHDIADLGRLEQILDRAVAAARRASSRARIARPHDRDQGPPRRLDHGHPRAHGRGADQRPGADRRDRARRCCAPTRRRARCGCSGSGWPRSASPSAGPRARSR